MLLNNDEIESRLNHPDNLMNRMSSLRGNNSNNNSAMEIFGVNDSRDKATIPALPPSVDDLIDDVETKVKSTAAYTGALDTLVDSVQLLRARLLEVEKPEKLSRIASDMHRIVNDINESRNGKRSGDGNSIIVYKPIILNESAFQVVHASE